MLSLLCKSNYRKSFKSHVNHLPPSSISHETIQQRILQLNGTLRCQPTVKKNEEKSFLKNKLTNIYCQRGKVSLIQKRKAKRVAEWIPWGNFEIEFDIKRWQQTRYITYLRGHIRNRKRDPDFKNYGKIRSYLSCSLYCLGS